MLELKITIAAPDLSAAINNLAAALANGNTAPVQKATTSVTSVPVALPATPSAPVNPTTAQAIPQIVKPATIAPTVNPAVPMAPVNNTPAQTVPTATSVNPVPATAIPTSAPQYTLEMIARAGTALIDAGKLDQVMQLLGKFGVVTLTDLSPDSYGAVAAELRALGATI